MKTDLDEKIDGKAVSPSGNSGTNNSSTIGIPTDNEMKNLFAKLNESKVKPVILSLVPPYAEGFVLKSRRISTLSDLFDPTNLKMNCPELLKKCLEIELPLSEADRDKAHCMNKIREIRQGELHSSNTELVVLELQ